MISCSSVTLAEYQAFLSERKKREEKKGEGKNTLSLGPFTEGLILWLMLPVKFIRPSVGNDALATIHQQRRNNKLYFISRVAFQHNLIR